MLQYTLSIQEGGFTLNTKTSLFKASNLLYYFRIYRHEEEKRKEELSYFNTKLKYGDVISAPHIFGGEGIITGLVSGGLAGKIEEDGTHSSYIKKLFQIFSLSDNTLKLIDIEDTDITLLSNSDSKLPQNYQAILFLSFDIDLNIDIEQSTDSYLSPINDVELFLLNNYQFID